VDRVAEQVAGPAASAESQTENNSQQVAALVALDPNVQTDRNLRRISTLLTVLVFGALTVFCFYASTICIVLVVSAFLAVLIDPAVVRMERARVPRALASAMIILAAMALIALGAHQLYGGTMRFVEELPVYQERLQQALQPINRKIETVQETAGRLADDGKPQKKVPVVQVKQGPSWPGYLLRGVGSVWDAVVILGFVPFLTFFMLCSKQPMALRMNNLFAGRMDVPCFLANLKQMLRGFVAGNLVVGGVMAATTTAMLLAIGLNGAVPIGIVSGLFNVVPFLGLVFALALPLAAALLQFSTAMPFLVIGLTILLLHAISVNLLVPRFIGNRLNIGPVAATIGLLFWGWLWGIAGVVLAVPLTAFVKLVADTNPAYCHLSNILALKPRALSGWMSGNSIERAIPYLRGRLRIRAGSSSAPVEPAHRQSGHI
jgi:predicted PurR-regulated permease PerM